MYQRFFHLTNDQQSVFIFGPRGTGKTSWLKTNFKDALYFDLLSSTTFTEFLGAPELLESRIPSHYTGWVILDEIQRVPVLLNEVHRLIEERKIKFILTGSSARTLRRKGVNLLAGRALTYKMFPLTAVELGSDFHIETSLKQGHLPTPYAQSVNPEEYLNSYIHVYL